MNLFLQRHKPPGFTLVEVMVAMVITLIIMGGVYRTLSDEEVNHDRSEKILDMQNNARVALERIARDVRRTGSLGCGGSLAANTLANAVTTDTTFVNQYTIATDTTPPGLNWAGNKDILSILVDAAKGGASINFLGEVMGFNNNAVSTHNLYQEGTDAITLVYLSEERLVDSSTPPTLDTLTITAPGYNQYDLLYVTDCENYSLFQKTNGDDTKTVTHAANTELNIADADLKKNYGEQSAARVFKLNTATYFIHKDKFTLNVNRDVLPLASNIEDLQFEFLADENGNGNLSDDLWRPDLTLYSSPKAVRAVRIWLLAMSEPDFSYTDAFDSAGNKMLYIYPNSPYATQSPADLAPITSPSDGEHRHRFLASAVVYLRNAGL